MKRLVAILGLISLAWNLAASTPDTLAMTSSYSNIYLNCGDSYMIYDNGGANGPYFGAGTKYVSIRTNGTGSPIHVSVRGVTASGDVVSVFKAVSSSQPPQLNSLTDRVWYSGGVLHFDTICFTGACTIKFNVANTSTAHQYEGFAIRVWTTDSSEIYDVTNSNITTSSAHISWSDSSNATAWTVKYGTAENNLNLTVATTTTWVNLAGLTPNTPYYLRVYNNMGNTEERTGYCNTNGSFFITQGSNAIPVGCVGDFTDLSNENIICTYGHYHTPNENMGVVQGRHTAMTDTNGRDPRVGDSLRVVPVGASTSVRLGNDNVNNQSESILYRFQVDTSQYDMLLLKYAAVLQNPPAHTVDIQPRFTFQILREDGSEIDNACYTAEFVATTALGDAAGWNKHIDPTSASNVPVLWKDWSSVGVNLAPLHGQTLYIRLTTQDCNENEEDYHGQHFGYAYYTLQCGRKDMQYVGCGDTVPIDCTAPDGFEYFWHIQGQDDTLSAERTFTIPAASTQVYECTMTFHGSSDNICAFTMEVDPTSITCPPVTVHYPDNVNQDPCAFPIEASDWSIKIDDIVGRGSSSDSICTLLNPLVGDLDNDGTPEIVCFSTKNASNNAFSGGGNPGSKVKNVVVYDGLTHRLKAKFDLPQYVSAFEATPFGLAKPYGGQGIMVFACTDNKLYAYQLDGNGGATQLWGAKTFGSGNDYSTVVGFADFNNDSLPEVYVRNKIFNLLTGDLLLTVSSSNSGSTYAHVGNSSAGSRKPLAASFATDIVGDQRCELLLGNEIHSIHITNTTGATGNSSSLYATAPTSIISDGHAQVADFNLDGHLDVFVSIRNNSANSATINAYVWDVFNNTVSAPITQSVSQPGKSIPLIADIDNDDSLEVVLHCGVPGGNIRAYKYHADANAFSLFWTRGFSEDSYSNSMTLFDFNQDGESELLICDNDKISIVNGSSPTLAQQTLYQYPFKEVTIMQYPIIADIDNDGAAEILFVGKENTQSFQGTLNICRSNGDPWAPARPVWNQYMYNITCINKDLTVPSTIFNNAYAFVEPTPVANIAHRPYNNFLQQATNIDTNGLPYRTAPDLLVGSPSATQTDSSIVLHFDICNQGESALSTDTLFVSMYRNGYRGTYIDQLENVNVQEGKLVINPDQCLTIDIALPSTMFCPFLPIDSIAFAINDHLGNGVGRPITSDGSDIADECDTTNNVFTLPISLAATRDSIYDTICQSQPYSAHGFNIAATRTSQPGLLVDSLEVSVGCGRTTILFLTIHPASQSDTTATACNSFTWYGNTYYSSDTIIHPFQSVSGCDSIVRLILTINYNDTITDTLSFCYATDYRGYHFSTTMDTVLTFSHQGMCDSVIELHLDRHESVITDYYDTVCQGSAYSQHGFSIDTNRTQSPGLLLDTLPIQSFCGDTVYLHLLVSPKYTVDTVATACESFTWYGTDYTSSGIHTHQGGTIADCDSIVRLTLTILYNDTISDTLLFCGMGSYRGHNFNHQGDTVLRYTHPGVCDSLIQLHLEKQADLHVVQGASVIAMQDGAHLTLSVHNQGSLPFVTDTLVTTVYANAFRENYVVRIRKYNQAGGSFVINPDATESLDIVIPFSMLCEFTPIDTLYFAVNEYFGFKHNPDGSPSECDTTNNVIALPFSLDRQFHTYYDTVCPGTAYNQHGFNIPATRTAQAGQVLDSIEVPSFCGDMDYLVLTVLPTPHSDTSAAVCQSLRWYGQDYTVTGEFDHTLVSSYGCDSVITLHLTIYPVYAADLPASICQGESYTFAGARYDATGRYSHTFTSVYGCDSVITLDLTVNPNYNLVDSVVMCSSDPSEGYIWIDGGIYFHSTNTPTFTLRTAQGCDSTLRLNLTIDRSLKAQIYYTPAHPSFDNPHICLTNASSNSSSCQWFLYDGTSSTENTFCFDAPIEYDSLPVEIVVASLSGCFDTTVIHIPIDHSSIYIPNVFTPDLSQPNLNSTFYIVSRQILEMEVTIFNREGLLIASFDGLTQFWDGTHDGTKCPQGTYVYHIRYRTAPQPGEWQYKVGTITLLR